MKKHHSSLYIHISNQYIRIWLFTNKEVILHGVNNFLFLFYIKRLEQYYL